MIPCKGETLSRFLSQKVFTLEILIMFFPYGIEHIDSKNSPPEISIAMFITGRFKTQPAADRPQPPVLAGCHCSEAFRRIATGQNRRFRAVNRRLSFEAAP